MCACKERENKGTRIGSVLFRPQRQRDHSLPRLAGRVLLRKECSFGRGGWTDIRAVCSEAACGREEDQLGHVTVQEPRTCAERHGNWQAWTDTCADDRNADVLGCEAARVGLAISLTPDSCFLSTHGAAEASLPFYGESEETVPVEGL